MDTLKYSLNEVKKAEIDPKVLRFNHIPIDARRVTVHDENIEKLKALELKTKPINTRKPKNKPKKTAKPIKEEPKKPAAAKPASKASAKATVKPAAKLAPVKAETPAEVNKKAPTEKVTLTKAPKKSKVKEAEEKPVEKVEEEEKIVKPSEVAATGRVQGKGTPIESLAKIDKKQIQKLNDLGIKTVEELAAEDLKNISKLSKISQKQLTSWVEDNKK